MKIKPMLLALALTLLQDAGAWDIAGPASASRLAGSSVSFTALPLGTTDIRLYLINATGSYSAHDAQVQSATCAADFRAGARDDVTLPLAPPTRQRIQLYLLLIPRML